LGRFGGGTAWDCSGFVFAVTVVVGRAFGGAPEPGAPRTVSDGGPVLSGGRAAESRRECAGPGGSVRESYAREFGPGGRNGDTTTRPRCLGGHRGACSESAVRPVGIPLPIRSPFGFRNRSPAPFWRNVQTVARRVLLTTRGTSEPATGPVTVDAAGLRRSQLRLPPWEWQGDNGRRSRR